MEMVQLLLAATANCDAATHDGLSPLHSAVLRGHLQVAGVTVGCQGSLV